MAIPKESLNALEDKTNDATTQVFLSVVQAFEDMGLHKTEAVDQAYQVKIQVRNSILDKLSQDEGGE